jgi:pimeloyl-ACP methyl ester carboxylesterase
MKSTWLNWIGLSTGLALLIAAGWVGFQLLSKQELNANVRGDLGGSYAKLTEGTVHYQLSGPPGGELVVLIHGFSVPSYVWEATVPALTGEGYRVLSYDLWGRGWSDRPDAAYNLALFTAQLEQLWQLLELEGPAHLIGLSMGGPIAARYAADHPDRILTVSLIAPEAERTTVQTIFPLNLPGIGELIMTAYLEPVLLPSLQVKDFHDPAGFPDWEARYREQIRYRGFGPALLSTIRHLPEVDPVHEYRQVSRLDIPVLLVWGEEDQTFSRADMREVQQAFSEVSFHPIPEAGHLPHLERPELVNPRLLTFLASARK